MSAETEKPGKQKNDSEKMELQDWLQCLVIALLVSILLFVFVARIVSVEGTSMVPTFLHTDRVLISNLCYAPSTGDVVVLQTDSYGGEPLIKRVIATEGQTIDIDFEAGVVYVDGVALDEPYTAAPTYERLDFSGPVTVPDGCVFVMGDNRNGSTDSRDDRIGMVDCRCILGKVLFILQPAADHSGFRDWSRFGNVYG